MSLYRFVGDKAEIEGVIVLHRYGQLCELEDSLAERAVLEDVPLLPEAAFDALGHTEKELSLYFNAILAENAPADFKAKKVQANVAFHELKASLSR
jgi:hypothetical protein